MSNVLMLLDGARLTVFPNGVIGGEHELVHLLNVKVRHTAYSPNRQQTAVSLLKQLGAVTEDAADDQLLALPAEFDPFVWY